MKQVIVQSWTESESGWGQRPDGYTVHLTENERLAFIKNYNKHLADLYEGYAMSEYSFPDDKAYVGDVDDEIYVKLIIEHKKSDSIHGIWNHDKAPPKYKIRTTYENEQQQQK